ncbi:MAG: hypothetical protein ACO3LE_03995 [Bdellovibrionota bacterium]
MMLTNILFSFLITAQEPATNNVPPVMYQFLEQVIHLQPEFSSPSAFKSEKNRKKISASLKKMSELSKSLDSHERLNDPIFKMTADLVKNQISEAYTSFQKGHYEYSRRLFQESLDACSSCHNQVPKRKDLSWEFKADQLQGSAYQKAEFWFTVRQYQKALPLYEQFISTYNSEKDPSYQLDLALQRVASILIRNDLDLDRAQVDFIKLSTNQRLPSATRAKLRQWAEEASKLSQSGMTKSKIQNQKDVEKWARSFLDGRADAKETSDAESIKALFLSGALYQYVHQSKNLNPEVLYYLSQCEDVLDDDFFLSLGNVYLRRCIVEFPQSKMATTCLNDLKQKTELAFTGSAGVQIPDDVAQDLKSLENKISTAQKNKK